MTAARYPLATERGVRMFANILALQNIWRGLTGPQREALAGPDIDRIGGNSRVHAALRTKELVDKTGYLTDLGEAVVHYRPVKP